MPLSLSSGLTVEQVKAIYQRDVAYTIHIAELCLQFAASSEQEMEMTIDPAVTKP